jgi:hypothetical protein
LLTAAAGDTDVTSQRLRIKFRSSGRIPRLRLKALDQEIIDREYTGAP